MTGLEATGGGPEIVHELLIDYVIKAVIVAAAVILVLVAAVLIYKKGIGRR